jgi:membrane associated rhomboid family serine protease
MVEASVGHQCPECVARGRQETRPARTAFGGGGGIGARGYVTTTLITINVLALLLAGLIGGSGAIFSGGLFTGSTEVLRDGGMLGMARYSAGTAMHGVAAGEYYRLFTAMFLHYGVLHLLMNMWALWILGRVLEAVLGPVRFLALYLLAGLGGSVAMYLFSSPQTLGAGASGAIFGLFSGLFLILKRMRRDTSSVVPLLVINLIVTFVVPGISISAHLGGLVTGAIVAAGLAYAPKAARTPVQTGVVLGTLLLIGLLIAWRTATLT